MWLALIVLVALMIPVFGILVDSPIGRALARRLEKGEPPPADVAELTRRVELLEGEVEELTRGVDQLREENQFLQRLVEAPPGRATLPPAGPP